MSRVIFLDTGPLGLLTNPKRGQKTLAALQWAFAMTQAGHHFVVPSIADYEVRRELERAGQTAGIAAPDAWNNAVADRYLLLSDNALRLGSKLWAQARNAGTPTADPKELDGDVLIAAQVLGQSLPSSSFVVATTNPGHLGLFVPAELWTNIIP